MHTVTFSNTHHDVTDLVNLEMVKNAKTWLSWERNITFLQNKKIISLSLWWRIVRNYNFVVEVTFKIRNYINEEVLRSIYFSIFDSHLNYANLIWTENSSAIQRIFTTKITTKKSHQNNIISASKISFKSFFQKNNILKFSDETDR